MIGLDTNVLLRLALRDDEGQYNRVRRLLDRDLPGERSAYINCIVLVEFVWTLRRVYRLSIAAILVEVEKLLNSQNVEFRELIAAAIAASRRSGIDLSDALIAGINSQDGCGETVTFDIDFAKSGEAALLE